MEILIFSQEDVRRLLPMKECIEAMEGALRGLAEGKAVQPLRPVMWLPDRRGAVGLMPAWAQEPAAAGVKVVTVFPGNHGTEYDTHQGAVLLFDAEHGNLLAMADGAEITAIRTAAVSGLATRLLANPGAGDLAILGSGVQARQHLEAMSLVRRLRRVRVWSPTPANREAFANQQSGLFQVEVEACDTARQAVEGADLVCTTTAAREPVLKGDWIAGGAHVNAVGSSFRTSRELDTGAMLRSRLFIDRLESTLNEAGDFLIPKEEGALDESHIQGEIGDILIGKIEGRQGEDEITLFKSLGLGIEDVTAIRLIYESGQRRGLGNAVPFGGWKHASH